MRHLWKNGRVETGLSTLCRPIASKEENSRSIIISPSRKEFLTTWTCDRVHIIGMLADLKFSLVDELPALRDCTTSVSAPPSVPASTRNHQIHGEHMNNHAQFYRQNILSLRPLQLDCEHISSGHVLQQEVHTAVRSAVMVERPQMSLASRSEPHECIRS